MNFDISIPKLSRCSFLLFVVCQSCLGFDLACIMSVEGGELEEATLAEMANCLAIVEADGAATPTKPLAGRLSHGNRSAGPRSEPLPSCFLCKTTDSESFTKHKCRLFCTSACLKAVKCHERQLTNLDDVPRARIQDEKMKEEEEAAWCDLVMPLVTTGESSWRSKRVLDLHKEGLQRHSYCDRYEESGHGKTGVWH